MQIHNHNQEQRDVLVGMLNDVISKLLAVRFANPADDSQNIRYHAALTGKYELLVGMLQDNYDAPEPINPEGN